MTNKTDMPLRRMPFTPESTPPYADGYAAYIDDIMIQSLQKYNAKATTLI